MDPHLVIQLGGGVGLYTLFVGSRTVPRSDDLDQHIKQCLREKGRVLVVPARGRVAAVGPKLIPFPNKDTRTEAEKYQDAIARQDAAERSEARRERLAELLSDDFERAQKRKASRWRGRLRLRRPGALSSVSR